MTPELAGFRPGVALAVFLVTYALVSTRRVPWLPIGRPAVALAGAAAMVLVAGLPSGLAYRAIDGDTLVLLLGMMLVGAHLELGGASAAADRVVLRAVPSPAAFLWCVLLGAGVASALLVNDTVCVLATPVVLHVCRRRRARPLPFLLALAMGSNAGSAATLVGNPQNMIVGSLSGIGYADFALRLLLPAAVGLLATGAVLHALHRHSLAADRAAWRGAPPRSAALGLPADADLPATAAAPVAPLARPDPRALVGGAAVALALAALFTLGAPLAWSALGGGALLLVALRRDAQPVLHAVNFPLLAFFAGLFVVIGGLEATGVPAQVFASLRTVLGDTPERQTWLLAAATLPLANLFSNVPYVLLSARFVPGFADPELAWCALSLAATLAGNLTLVGSVANLIVAEEAREESALGFRSYLRSGVPATLVAMPLAVATLLALR